MKNTKNHRSKIKTLPSYQLPFDESLVIMILSKCQKIIHDLQRFNVNMLKINFSILDKDMELLKPRYPDYGRIKSLVLNMKSSYNQKQGNFESALQKIQEAIQLEKTYKIDKVDMGITFLNKRKNSDIYNQQDSNLCIKMALQHIQDRKKYRVINKQHIKLGQITLQLFYYYINEISIFQINKQSVIFYKRAYKIALEYLGSQHHLSCKLKNTLQNIKKTKKKQKRARTQSSLQESITTKMTMIKSSKYKKLKQMKYRSFFKVYGYVSDDRSKQKEKNKSQIEAFQMKELEKITNIYNPKKTQSYLPKLPKHKRNIKDILMSRTQNHSQNIRPLTHKKNQLRQQTSLCQQKLDTVQIVNPKSVQPRSSPEQQQQMIDKKQIQQFKKQQIKQRKIKKHQQSNCCIM